MNVVVDCVIKEVRLKWVFQIKKVTGLLFCLRDLAFFCNLKSFYNDLGKCLGFIKPNKFSLDGRVVNAEDWLSLWASTLSEQK